MDGSPAPVMTTRGVILAERAAAHLGRRAAGWRRVPRGYSQAERIVVTLDDGGSAFVKGAVDSFSAAWLRIEHSLYSDVRAPFMPELRGWQDDGEAPFLVLEDLSAALWPPPWTPALVGRVIETLRSVAAHAPPAWCESMEHRRAWLEGWPRVGRDPQPFLRLGLASEDWLVRSIDTLAAAERLAPLAGDALLHNDVRSDNLCVVGDRVVLIDWNWACRGNATVDVAGWLPSLAMEGGPEPESILPREPELAALISGYYAAHAGLPPPVGVSTALRALQLAQLRTSLAWTIRALRLPPLDGPSKGDR